MASRRQLLSSNRHTGLGVQEEEMQFSLRELSQAEAPVAAELSIHLRANI